jgi:hypothetical protein
MFVSIQFCEKIVIDCDVVRYSLWICFVFCQKDGFFESFNRHNRTFIGLTGA